MAKRFYSGSFISESASSQCHLPEEVVNKVIGGGSNFKDGKIASLFDGVEELMSKNSSDFNREVTPKKS